ncbi:LxmA leader domain family RiPP [Streptomyces sp. NPDC097640]
MNNLISGYSAYTSAAEFGAATFDEAPATTSAPCAVGTIIILTIGAVC